MILLNHWRINGMYIEFLKDFDGNIYFVNVDKEELFRNSEREPCYAFILSHIEGND